MRIDEIEDVEENYEEEAHDQLMVAGRRFACDDFYIRCQILVLLCGYRLYEIKR